MLFTLHSSLCVLNIAYVLKYLTHYYVGKVKCGIHTVVGLLRHGKMREWRKVDGLAQCFMSVSDASGSSLTKESTVQ